MVRVTYRAVEKHGDLWGMMALSGPLHDGLFAELAFPAYGDSRIPRVNNPFFYGTEAKLEGLYRRGTIPEGLRSKLPETGIVELPMEELGLGSRVDGVKYLFCASGTQFVSGKNRAKKPYMPEEFAEWPY